MARMREANEHLVVAAVRAQTLTEEAETASHLKDDFLAMVSHEIRTPLNAVLGWARMLESKQLPPERAEHAIAAIGRSASALAEMIDDILDASRILKGAVRLTLRPVDLMAVASPGVGHGATFTVGLPLAAFGQLRPARWLIDELSRRRPRPRRVYLGSTGCAFWSSMTTSTGAR